MLLIKKFRVLNWSFKKCLIHIIEVNLINQSVTIVYTSHTQLNAHQGTETSAQHVFDSIVISVVKKEKCLTSYWF